MLRAQYIEMTIITQVIQCHFELACEIIIISKVRKKTIVKVCHVNQRLKIQGVSSDWR